MLTDACGPILVLVELCIEGAQPAFTWCPEFVCIRSLTCTLWCCWVCVLQDAADFKDSHAAQVAHDAMLDDRLQRDRRIQL
jgi:hypothetical protein